MENTKPPYATDIIYYIAKENALARWDDKTNSFVVLNVTATKFEELETKVSSHITKIESAQVLENVAKIGDLEESINALRELLGESGSGDSSAVSIVSRIEALENNESVIAGKIETIEGKFTEIAATYQTLTKAAEEHKAITDRIDAIDGENGQIATLNTKIENLTQDGGRIDEIE
jgi:DNA repair exonuclease SbcCD ATPase subunit